MTTQITKVVSNAPKHTITDWLIITLIPAALPVALIVNGIMATLPEQEKTVTVQQEKPLSSYCRSFETTSAQINCHFRD